MGGHLPIPPGLERELRGLHGGNAGAFTLDGTRTWIVGHRQPAIIEPGPDMADHVRAVVRLVEGAEAATLLLSHGHGDHAGAVEALMEALVERGVRARVAGAGHSRAEPLGEGDVVETDAGPISVLRTPGHTPDHLAFHWPRRKALFPGDLVLGRGDTTWVAGYDRCVADYLASVERLRGLDLDLILPAHGPLIEDPPAALTRFLDHRRRRIRQVRSARDAHPGASPRELLEEVYGDQVPPELEEAAVASLAALLDYVEQTEAGGEG